MARLGPAVLVVIGAIGCSGGTPLDPTPSSLVPVASLTISSPKDTVFVGDTLLMTVTARDSAGNLLSGRAVHWQSSAGNVATITSQGLVTGVGPGKTTISAAAGSQSAALTLVVKRLVFSVNVVPDAVCLRKGFTTFLSITAFDSLGKPLAAGIRPVTWRTSNGLVVTVTPASGDSSVVLGVAPGTALVSGAIAGVADTTVMIVDATPLGQPLQCSGG